MNGQARKIHVRGVVTAITYPGVGSSPMVQVQLRVGNDSVSLAFLGRQDLHAVEIGTSLEAKGALVDRRGTPTLYNPEFTVVADSGAEEEI